MEPAVYEYLVGASATPTTFSGAWRVLPTYGAELVRGGRLCDSDADFEMFSPTDPVDAVDDAGRATPPS